MANLLPSLSVLSSARFSPFLFNRRDQGASISLHGGATPPPVTPPQPVPAPPTPLPPKSSAHPTPHTEVRALQTAAPQIPPTKPFISKRFSLPPGLTAFAPHQSQPPVRMFNWRSLLRPLDVQPPPIPTPPPIALATPPHNDPPSEAPPPSLLGNDPFLGTPVIDMSHPPAPQYSKTTSQLAMALPYSMLMFGCLRPLDMRIRQMALTIPVHGPRAGAVAAALGTATTCTLRVFSEEPLQDQKPLIRSLVFASISLAVHPLRIQDVCHATPHKGKLFPSGPLTVLREGLFRYVQLNIKDYLDTHFAAKTSMPLDFSTTMVSTVVATALSSAIAFAALNTTAGEPITITKSTLNRFTKALPPSIARMAIMMAILWGSTHQDALANEMREIARTSTPVSRDPEARELLDMHTLFS